MTNALIMPPIKGQTTSIILKFKKHVYNLQFFYHTHKLYSCWSSVLYISALTFLNA